MESLKFYPIAISDDSLLLYDPNGANGNDGIMLKRGSTTEYAVQIAGVLTRPNNLLKIPDSDLSEFVCSLMDSYIIRKTRPIPEEFFPAKIPPIKLNRAQEWLKEVLPTYGIPFESSKI